MSIGGPTNSTDVEQVLADYIVAHERGAVPDVAAFCALHPSCASELADLIREYHVVRSRLEREPDTHPDLAPPAPAP